MRWKIFSPATSPAYVVSVIALLVGLQGQALARQWWLGFRPFRKAPDRVAYSWDMFAIPIERCGVGWEPAIPRAGKAVVSMHDLAAPIEWDPVYNQRADYIEVGYAGCAERPWAAGEVGGGFRVDCFTAKGGQTHDEIACPPR